MTNERVPVKTLIASAVVGVGLATAGTNEVVFESNVPVGFTLLYVGIAAL